MSLVEVESDAKVLVRHSGDAVALPDAVSWVSVDLRNEDGTEGVEGSYYTSVSQMSGLRRKSS